MNDPREPNTSSVEESAREPNTEFNSEPESADADREPNTEFVREPNTES